MPKARTSKAGVEATPVEVAELRARLEEAEETLRAIRSGEVDGLVVSGPEGDKIYTLRGAEHPYRVLIEAMSEGALTISVEGTILYSNRRFSDMLQIPLERVIGSSLYDLVAPGGRQKLQALVQVSTVGRSRQEIDLRKGDGRSVPVYLSASSLAIEGVHAICVVATDLTERKRNEEIKRSEQALRARTHQQAVVAELGQLALEGTGLSAFMREAASVISQTLEAEYCFILELLPVGHELRLREGVAWKEGIADHATISTRPDSQWGFTLLSGQPVVVEDLRVEKRFNCPPLVHDQRVISGVTVIMHGKDRPFGVLGAHTTERRIFTEDDVNFLQAIANVLASTIERERDHDALLQNADRLQTLSRRLLNVQEKERRHLARELHDEIGQVLTAVQINLEAISRSSSAVDVAPRLEESIGMVERALGQVRDLSLDLRPSMLDDLGLVSALLWYAERQEQRTGIPTTFVADQMEMRLPADVETACFRVAQEALTNVARHARARHVEIRFRHHHGELELAIHDDGVGFDVDAARGRAVHGVSLGLLGMEEGVDLVGGNLRIVSGPAHGTTVQVFFPLHTAQPSYPAWAASPAL
jgi:PAS domain S-box-containing protein